MKKTRFIVIFSVLLLSLGLATAALAAASATHTANLITEITSPQIAGARLPDEPPPFLPEGRQSPQAYRLPAGAIWRGPQSPNTPGDWDSITVNFPRVISDTGQYRMWYDGRGQGWAMGAADSPDGDAWTKDAANPILQPGAAGQWDDLYRGQAALMKEGSEYKMWYSGGGSAGPWQTGYATSTNGIDWNIYPSNPVLPVGAPGSWDEQEANGPAVINDGGIYKMWYHGCDGPYSACSIGYATSPDGITWTKDAGNPVLTGTGGAWDEFVLWPSVIKNGSVFEMWYWGIDASFSATGIGFATSPDGIVWTKYAGNPILTDGWDGGGVSGQYVMLEDSTYKMWLRSGQGTTYGIGFATSPDGINWTMYFGNPVLTPGSPGLQIYVNYAHEWVYATTVPSVPITITVAGKATVVGMTNENGEFASWWSSWDPSQPDIAPGDAVTATVPSVSTAINPIGTITGDLDADADTISGTIQAPFSALTLTVRCEVWVENSPPPIVVTGVPADGGSYFCDFGTEGWDILPGQSVAVMYSEPDDDWVINVFEPPWARVNYAHDWVGANYPAGHTFWITVTNGVGDFKAVAQIDTVPNGGWGAEGFQTQWNNWTPSQPDIQEGDWAYFRSDDGYANDMHVGIISGTVDSATDSVSGPIYADWFSGTLNVECHPWGGPPSAPVKNSTAGVNGSPPYFCQWDPGSEWDVQLGQDIAVMYIEPDADRVINVLFEPDPNLYLRVNYSHDWIESFYEAGRTIWITVTDNVGNIKDTATGQSGVIPWWGGGQTGFVTDYNVLWASGQRPDLVAGDWVYGALDTGYSASVQIGEISGYLDLSADLITGTINAPWFTQTLSADCGVWVEGGPGMSFDVEPNNGPYACDFTGQWDLIAGQDVGVSYLGTDNQRVYNVFQAPAPHLWIQKWADGNPGEGGNFTFYVQYQNDGAAVAENTVITDTLFGGMTYITDTSGFSHTGTGAPGDPLVWQLGDLPNAQYNTQFQVYVAITAPASSTITNTVQIETSTPYFQGDPESKQSTWSGHVIPNQTSLNIGKWPWTGDPVPGYDYVYTVNTCNNGGTGSAQVTLTDTLPLSTTLVTWWAYYPGWTEVASGPNLLVVSRPSIPGWQCSEVYIRVNLDANAWSGMTISNTAVVTATNDLDPNDNQTTVWHNAGDPRNNLSIYKNWNFGQLVPGGELHFELNYSNNGNLPVDNVLITSTLPVSATFTGAWHNDQYGQHPVTPTLVVQGEYVVWDIGALDNGYSGWFDIVLAVDGNAAPGTALTHTVEITTLPVEDDFDDNAITWMETLNDFGPNLRIDKRYWWNWEGALEYEIRILNVGTEPLDNFWITDTYPVSTTFTGEWWVNHGGWYTMTDDAPNGRVLFWGDYLDPGGTAGLGMRVYLDGAIIGQEGLTFVNAADAPISGDVYPADNYDEAMAFTGPDLYVEKSLAAGELLPGEIITYSLKFGNDQHGSAGWWGLQGNAWLTDTLPDEVEFISAELLYCGAENWCNFAPTVITGSVVAWQLWPLGSTEHNEIRLTVQITATATGLDELYNQAEIASDQPENDIEYNYTNNFDSLELPIALPYFEIGKTYESSQVAGTPVTYTLTVTNTGGWDGAGLRVADLLPISVTYLSGGVYSATTGLVTWDVASLAVGEAATVQFSGLLACTSALTVTNDSYQVTGSDEGVASPYGSPVSFEILTPTLDATLEASAGPYLTGETISFTATATTNGPPFAQYAWDFGDGALASGPLVGHAFTSPGFYTVTLTITDECSYTVTVELEVEVASSTYELVLPVVVKNR